MDDSSFELWSNTLLELRQSRQEAIQGQFDDKGSKYSSKDFYDYLMVSLDQILVRWWEFEKESWETSPPADMELATENLKSEISSVVDLELDSIDQDIEFIRTKVSWGGAELKQGKSDLGTFAEELKSNYLIKIDTLATSSSRKKQPPQPAPTGGGAPRQQRSRGGGGASSLGLLTMFLFGLALGGGAALYFRDSANRAHQKLEEERAKILHEQKSFLDSMTVLQETYFQLATGKLLNIPDIEKAMAPIQRKFSREKKDINRSFNKTREGLIRRIPAGERLDRSLAKLEKEKESKLDKLRAKLQTNLGPYLKQKQIHDDLLDN